MQRIVNIICCFLILGGVLLLSACGRDNNTYEFESPILHLELQQVKIFRFSWEEVRGAAAYRLFEDPDGVSGFSEVALLNADSLEYQHTVFLPGRVNARYLLQACNEDMCVDSTQVSVSGNLADAVGYFKLSEGRPLSGFGSVITLSADGNTLAVGLGEMIMLYVREDGIWSEYTSMEIAKDGVGSISSLSFSNDARLLAVGVANESFVTVDVSDGHDGVELAAAGAVYLFEKISGSWRQQAHIRPSVPESMTFFGRQLALSTDGRYLAVGASGYPPMVYEFDGDFSNFARNGAVYVFERDEGAWNQQIKIVAPYTYSGDQFGFNLALSDTAETLAVGGILADPESGGLVFVYTREADLWVQRSILRGSNPTQWNRFGSNVLLSSNGNILIAGDDGGDRHIVYTFFRNGDEWIERSNISIPTGDVFGYLVPSIAMSTDGSVLAVGVHADSNAGQGINDISYDSVIPWSGAVRVFSLHHDEWEETAYVKAPNTGENDLFGLGIALSANGDVLAVGAPGESSGATGIGGEQFDDSDPNSGAVFLY